MKTYKITVCSQYRTEDFVVEAESIGNILEKHLAMYTSKEMLTMSGNNVHFSFPIDLLKYIWIVLVEDEH